MFVPSRPQIYHIVHVDRLASIIADGYLWADSEVRKRGIGGTAIGMEHIKERRLNELTLDSHADLYVGQCVPFYFCPRSIMLFVIHVGNPALIHQEGQDSIIHLEADLYQSVAWANGKGRKWVFTTSNAGSYHFEDYSDLAELARIDWAAVHARYWSECKDEKQAEFLIERAFPWHLISRIGIRSNRVYATVQKALHGASHRPRVEVRPGWYY